MIRKLLRPMLLRLLKLFFNEKYLDGRYFNQNYIGFRWAINSIWTRNILRLNRPSRIPASSKCIISDDNNIFFDPDDLHIFQVPGTYFQNFSANIYIGKGSYIAPNVGLITANHDLLNLDGHTPGKDIHLGENCWVGMNSIVLPGVRLGANTVVAAGAVVTKSFPDGNVILGGVPAEVIRTGAL